MRTRQRTACIIIGLVLTASAAVAAAPPEPAEHFGFEPGADRHLLDYEQLIEYLEAVDGASDRLELREVGTSPQGRPMYVAFVSAPENLARLDELRTINERLAMDPDLSTEDRSELARNGRVFVMQTLSMHSTEVAPSQALPLFAYEAATTDDPLLLDRLSEVVLMFVPCHNPDGMDMVVEHYRKYRGTTYEGCSMPGVYHEYVGHDNNRDFVALTQADTRVVNRLYSTEWYPQVLVEKHQMGRTGPRYYVPPNHDPIALNVDEGQWQWIAVFGAALSRDMGEDGLSGVASHWAFDNYWPGSTETSLWKGVISFLTEAASCKLARPVFVEPTELSTWGKGLAEYAKSVNMPDPWEGGWWRLGDIVDYELSSMHSILETAAENRTEILRFRNELTRREVEKGRTEPPYYFAFPARQHDRGALPDLVELLQRHGVRVSRLTARTEVGGRVFEAGDVVVPLAQPYRAFVKEVLEAQEYPVRHYTPGGEVIRPYDIASWSLPLHRGLDVVELDERPARFEDLLEPVTADELRPDPPSLAGPVWGLGYPATDNASYRAAFLALERGLEVLRLDEPLTDTEPKLPTGSFIVRAEGGTDALKQLAGKIGTAPAVLAEEPDGPWTPLPAPRIGLVETWFHDMDAGWTRWVLDTFHVPYQVLRPGELAETDLAANFDVVVFPDASKHVLLEGAYKSGDRYRINDYPPEFREPVGKDGLRKIAELIDGGGIVVSWRRSTELFLDGLKLENDDGETETIQLPARDVYDGLKTKGLYVPGSFLAVELLDGHPLTRGMPSRSGVFSRGSPVFATSIPVLDMDRRVIATYSEDDVLLSGYAENEELLQERPVLVWLRKGAGQLVLFAFNPQFRGSTPATYKLLFNALLLEETPNGE